MWEMCRLRLKKGVGGKGLAPAGQSIPSVPWALDRAGSRHLQGILWNCPLGSASNLRWNKLERAEDLGEAAGIQAKATETAWLPMTRGAVLCSSMEPQDAWSDRLRQPLLRAVLRKLLCTVQGQSEWFHFYLWFSKVLLWGLWLHCIYPALSHQVSHHPIGFLSFEEVLNTISSDFFLPLLFFLLVVQQLHIPNIHNMLPQITKAPF